MSQENIKSVETQGVVAETNQPTWSTPTVTVVDVPDTALSPGIGADAACMSCGS